MSGSVEAVAPITALAGGRATVVLGLRAKRSYAALAGEFGLRKEFRLKFANLLTTL